jgi:outer membrane protein OmpA-like peptidoglycan-associated protein
MTTNIHPIMRRDITVARHCIWIGRALVSAGCAQSRNSYFPLRASEGIATQVQTIDLENPNRITRFRRLAALRGIVPAEIEETDAPGWGPGGQPDAVVRIAFGEQVFFDFDRDVPLIGVQPVLDLIADSMHRDVSGVALTVLGHTDAIGSDEYNIDLSRRRAAGVMAMLIARGVDSSHLSTVAIGKAQPIAPNSTEDGRAHNRRVEFLISGSQQANLAVIADREIKGGFFRTDADGPATLPISTDVQVLKPVGRSNALGDLDLLQPVALLPLRAPLPDDGVDQRQAGLAVLPLLPPRPGKVAGRIRTELIVEKRPPQASPTIRPQVAPAVPSIRQPEPMPDLRQPSDPKSY